MQHGSIYEALEFNTSKIDYKKLQSKVEELLKANDQEIIDDMQQREKESIVECKDVSKLNQLVQKGKVVKTYLKQDDDSVHKIESYLTGGEVLGFSIIADNGKDILTNEDVNTIAYISRRS